jgi:TetR/AcrR family transcriptional regulator
MATDLTTRPQKERADQTRARILEAAISAFSDCGLSGARMEQIAEAAGVNKALIYYYFQGKEALYDAAMDQMAETVLGGSLAAMNPERTAGERLAQFVLNHFDRIHSQQTFQSLMQQEMIRLRRGEENALSAIVEKVFRPMMELAGKLIAEGQQTGELIAVDPWQMMNAALGANSFYFLSSPVVSLLTGRDPFSRQELELRRKAAVEYLGQTIFRDRAHGAEVAARVIAATPMPPSGSFKHWQMKTVLR